MVAQIPYGFGLQILFDLLEAHGHVASLRRIERRNGHFLVRIQVSMERIAPRLPFLLDVHPFSISLLARKRSEKPCGSRLAFFKIRRVQNVDGEFSFSKFQKNGFQILAFFASSRMEFDFPVNPAYPRTDRCVDVFYRFGLHFENPFFVVSEFFAPAPNRA